MKYRYHARFSKKENQIMFYDSQNKSWDFEQPCCSIHEIKDFQKAEKESRSLTNSGPKTPNESPISEENRNSGPRNYSVSKSPANDRRRSNDWQTDTLIKIGEQQLMFSNNTRTTDNECVNRSYQDVNWDRVGKVFQMLETKVTDPESLAVLAALSASVNVAAKTKPN